MYMYLKLFFIGSFVWFLTVNVFFRHSEDYCHYINGFHCWCSEHQLTNMSYSQYADKHWAKEYVQQTVPGLKTAMEYTSEFVVSHDMITNKLLASLPKRYVVKPNHMSGEVVLVDGDKITCLNNLCDSCKQSGVLSCLRMMCKTWLNSDYMPHSELFYNGINRKCIFEEYLDNHGLPVDYRVFTFHGRPYFIQVDETFESKHTHDFFTPSWNRIQMNKGPGDFGQKALRNKPIFLDEMLQIAESMAHNFNMMRIDFFGYGNTYAFSEFTPAHHGCTGHFEPITIEQFYGMVAENASLHLDPELVLIFNN